MSTANYDPALVRDAYVNALAGSEDLSKYTDWLTAAADRYAADEMTADDWRIMWHILETANSVASYADGTRTVFLNYIELAGGLNPLQHTEYGFLRVDKAYMDLTHKRTEIIADNIGGGLGGVMDAFADALYDGAALDQMGADLFQRIDGPDVRTQTAVARQMSPMFLNATAESAHYGMSGLHRALGRRTEMHRLGQLGKTPQVPNGASAHGTQQGFAPLGNQWGAPVRMSETSGWLEGFGGGMDRDGSFSQTGYDGSFAGMSFGLEYSKLGRSVGLFGNYANHSVDSTDGRSKGDWGNIGIYARRERTCSFIEASMSMGFGDYDIHRNIFIPGAIFEDVGGGYIVLDPISARANGQSDAFSFSARLAGGRDLWDLAGWKVGTRAEMSLSCLGFDSYEETGAGALNLNIDNYGSSYWEGGVGLFAGKHFFFQTPLLKKRQHIQHRMQHLVASGKIMAMAGGMLGGDIDAQFADYGTSFSVDPDNDCDIWLLPEVTLSWNVRPGMVISGSYFGRWGDDITDNAGSLALNLFW